MASATSYNNFLNFSKEALVEFLSIRGISSSGKAKVELVALAYSAVQLNLPVKKSTEEVAKQLKNDYQSLLKRLDIEDPKNVPLEHRKDDCLQWPRLSLDDIVSYITAKRDHIGRHKREKAYS